MSIHRVALTRGRIVSVGDDHVAFRYRPVDGPTWRTMRLTPEEFLRRFLQHIPPPNAHVVRYYGLWAPGHRERFRRAQIVLSAELLEPVPPCDPESDAEAAAADGPSQTAGRCPYCGSPCLIHLRSLPAEPRAPPRQCPPADSPR